MPSDTFKLCCPWWEPLLQGPFCTAFHGERELQPCAESCTQEDWFFYTSWTSTWGASSTSCSSWWRERRRNFLNETTWKHDDLLPPLLSGEGLWLKFCVQDLIFNKLFLSSIVSYLRSLFMYSKFQTKDLSHTIYPFIQIYYIILKLRCGPLISHLRFFFFNLTCTHKFSNLIWGVTSTIATFYLCSCSFLFLLLLHTRWGWLWIFEDTTWTRCQQWQDHPLYALVQ